MSINTVLLLSFLWILVNIIQSCTAFGCANGVTNDTEINNTDMLLCKVLAYRTNRIAAIDINNIDQARVDLTGIVRRNKFIILNVEYFFFLKFKGRSTLQ